jgi:hypothetical protein
MSKSKKNDQAEADANSVVINGIAYTPEQLKAAAARVAEQAAKRAAYNATRVLTPEQKAARLAANKEYRAAHPLTEGQKAARLEYGKTRREHNKAVFAAAKAAGLV